MSGFLLRRALSALGVLFAVALLVFVLARLAPGGPFDEERELPKDVRAALEARWHLNESLPRQFGWFLAGAVRGDLGPSMRQLDWSVGEIVRSAFPVSAAPAALAMAWGVPVGLWIGARAAGRPGGPADAAATGASLAGVALPTFVVAPLIAMIFAFGLGWFPPGGWGTLAQAILPGVALGLPVCAVVARLARSATREQLTRDYCRTARAKGVPEPVIVTRHALRNGILPVLNYLGPAAASALTGSFVVEKVFALLVVLNAAVDVACAALDPRLREGV